MNDATHHCEVAMLTLKSGTAVSTSDGFAAEKEDSEIDPNEINFGSTPNAESFSPLCSILTAHGSASRKGSAD